MYHVMYHVNFGDVLSDVEVGWGCWKRWTKTSRDWLEETWEETTGKFGLGSFNGFS